jgi:hypothetical protein
MTISVRQVVFSDDGGVSVGNTWTVTLTDVQQGSLIHIFGCATDAAAVATSVTDPTNGTYSAIFETFDDVPDQQLFWQSYKSNVAATPGSLVITAHWPNAGTHYRGLCAVEITDAALSSALDGHAHNSQSAPGTGTNALSVGPPSPNNVNSPALIVALVSDQNGTGTCSVGSGFTDWGTGWIWNGPQNTTRAQSKRITAASMAATATALTGGSDLWVSFEAIYDEVAQTTDSLYFGSD